MKFFLGLIGLCFFATHSAAEVFTNVKGVSLEGEIRAYDKEAQTVTLHIPARQKEFTIPLDSLAVESQAKVKAWHEASRPKPAEWVKPGATRNLEFADLGSCNHDGSPLNCNIYVPSNYTPDSPVPLLVWLTGGPGGNGLAAAYALAGRDDFVCVSLPYPAFEGRSILDRLRDDGLSEFWDVHRSMLDAIAEAIPNIDPKVRAIAGFSNGAHSIGGYCSQVGAEFGSYFNVFIFGDGGIHGGNWPKKSLRDAHAYICWGEDSNNKKMGLATSEACDRARMIVTQSEMSETGHKFTEEEKAKVKAWLFGTVVPERRAVASE